MSIREDLKTAHMTAAEERWGRACREMQELLAESNEYSALAKRLFTCHCMTRFYAFGGWDYGAHRGSKSYQGAPHDPCDLLEFVHHFVTYHIRKHGVPAVAYWRYAHRKDDPPSETYLLCDKDDADAQPYFHRSREEFQDDAGCEWSEVEKLTAKRAIEIIDGYEQNYEPDEDQRKLTALITELEAVIQPISPDEVRPVGLI